MTYYSKTAPVIGIGFKSVTTCPTIALNRPQASLEVRVKRNLLLPFPSQKILQIWLISDDNNHMVSVPQDPSSRRRRSEPQSSDPKPR